MKIIETKEIPEFKPVTVVFESQGEIDYIAALLGASGQHIADFMGIKVITHQLFDEFLHISKEHIIAEMSDKISIKTVTEEF